MTVVFTVGDPRIIDSGDASKSSMTNIISVAGRAKKLVGNELFSDAAFLVGPDEKTAERIPVHTIFLKMASDSFAAMFSGKFKKEESIRIPDHSPSAVYSLLRWVYCEELVFEAGKLTDVLRIARLYFVDSLINFVTNLFVRGDQTFVWSFLSFAVIFKEVKLINKCLDRITIRAKESFASNDFLYATSPIVTYVLSLDFKMKEIDIFKRCLDWAAEECMRQGMDPTPANKRKVMQPFLHKFAFPGMGSRPFAGLPCESGVLTAEEKVTIFRLAVGQEVESPLPQKGTNEQTQLLRGLVVGIAIWNL